MARRRRNGSENCGTGDVPVGFAVYGGILRDELRRARVRRAETCEAADAQEPVALLDFVSWSLVIPTARGTALDFARYPFQREIYGVFADPTVKDAVVMKGTQLGISELLIRLALYSADVHGETALYVFATAKQLRDFSDTRVDGLLRHSAYLRQRAGPLWNKGLKQLGDGYCFFRGSQAKAELIAVDADLLLLDEYDDLAPVNIPEAEQRVGASKLAVIRRVGVPNDPEYGAAKLFRESDQREWHVDCLDCGETQPLGFTANVRWDEDDDGAIANARVVCRACEQSLEVGSGRWIAAYPQRPRPGFHVHRQLRRACCLVLKTTRCRCAFKLAKRRCRSRASSQVVRLLRAGSCALSFESTEDVLCRRRR